VQTWLIIATASISCGGAALVAPAPSRVEITASKPPRADFTVVPAELTDPGVLDRIPHRVRVRRFGNAWIREDQGEPTNTRHSGSDVDLVLPVIGETRTKIRVAFEDDEARLALWIARSDTWPSIAIPIELSDRSGVAVRDAGVFALRGAPVELGEHAGDRRAVRIRDELIEIRGYVPDAVISNVWLAAAGDPPGSFKTSSYETWSPPADLRTRVKLLIDTKIRVAPEPTAAVIATVQSTEMIARIANNLGEYRQIEIVRPHAKIRGYVLASEVAYTSDDLQSHGTGTGHGFGMSHADRIDVTAGACLFDRIDGEVIGVQSEPSTRLGRKDRDGTKWSQIHIGTSWTIATVYIRDLGDDPTQPRWESCTQPAHR
jgi:hypothetical protein